MQVSEGEAGAAAAALLASLRTSEPTENLEEQLPDEENALTVPFTESAWTWVRESAASSKVFVSTCNKLKF